MTTLALTIYRGLTFGPLVIDVLDADGAAYNLAGHTAQAEVRGDPSGVVILDLSPSVNEVTSEITIEKAYADTVGLADGNASWDLVLLTPTSKRIGPFIGGPVLITTAITQPA